MADLSLSLCVCVCVCVCVLQQASMAAAKKEAADATKKLKAHQQKLDALRLEIEVLVGEVEALQQQASQALVGIEKLMQVVEESKASVSKCNVCVNT
jgi:septal ring factor EnvC (AmiA/AmiB activator)